MSVHVFSFVEPLQYFQPRVRQTQAPIHHHLPDAILHAAQFSVRSAGCRLVNLEVPQRLDCHFLWPRIEDHLGNSQDG